MNIAGGERPGKVRRVIEMEKESIYIGTRQAKTRSLYCPMHSNVDTHRENFFSLSEMEDESVKFPWIHSIRKGLYSRKTKVEHVEIYGKLCN